MHATERAKLLVERILGFSRSGLGDKVPVNVESVVIETLELLQASLPADIRLQTRIDAANAAVTGDATYLHQVVMNLCTNAVQAMESGGLLSVVLDRAEVSDPRTLSRGTLAPRALCAAHRQRYRRRNSPRRSRPDVRSFFRDQGRSVKAPVLDFPSSMAS